MAKLAQTWFDELPKLARQALDAGKMGGGSIIKMADTGVTQDDIKRNHFWLRHVVQQFPDRVPSSFFLADALMSLMVEKTQ